MVLLQSLGNAGKQRSLDHIKSYLEPDVDVSVWRRVAVHSLRHFSCYEVSFTLKALSKIAAEIILKHCVSFVKDNKTTFPVNRLLFRHFT